MIWVPGGLFKAGLVQRVHLGHVFGVGRHEEPQSV